MSMVTTAQTQCHECGAALVGPYCHACGQPSTAVRRSFADALYGQTGRLARTLWLVVAKPGELAREIDEARDRRSTRPGALLANLIGVFLLVAGGVFGGASMEELSRQDPTGRLAAAVHKESLARGVSEDLLAERIGSRFRSTYSVVISLAAFVYAFAFWLLHRRQGKSWLVHLVAGVQYLCFTFLVSALVFGVTRALHMQAITDVVGYGTIGVLAIYIYFLQRRVYADAPGAAVLKTLAVVAIGSVSDSLLAVLAFAIAFYVA